MSVLDQLASSLGRQDEVPNVELAHRIALKKDKKAIAELIHLISTGTKNIQNDCIKVVYEVGALNPSLIAEHTNYFIELLGNKNNRLQWGAMAALDAMANENPKSIYAQLPKILKAAEQGSVITKDHTVNILIALCGHQPYASRAFDLLIEQLQSSRDNQLPMYAERAFPVIGEKNKTKFIQTLESRLPDIDKESKRKRIKQVIQKLGR